MNRTCFRNIGESSSFVKYMVPPRSSLLADPNPHKPPLLSPHDSLKTRITVQDRASTLSRTHPWRLHKILRGPSRNRISDHPRTTTRASPHPQRRSSAGTSILQRRGRGERRGRQRPEVSVSQRLLSVTVEKLDEKTHPRKPDPTVRTVVTHAAAAAAAAAARKGEMPFSWLPRRDKVWLTVRGAHGTYLHERVRPHRASLFKVSAGSFPFRSRKLATPSLPLHPTSRRQPGSRNTPVSPVCHRTPKAVSGRAFSLSFFTSKSSGSFPTLPPTNSATTPSTPTIADLGDGTNLEEGGRTMSQPGKRESLASPIIATKTESRPSVGPIRNGPHQHSAKRTQGYWMNYLVGVCDEGSPTKVCFPGD
ncbi:hypothetical protein BHE74_00006842 [Ensete ventricosum]|nr:hypothetical protein BHE74_00006842 [Ensete ventricosum]